MLHPALHGDRETFGSLQQSRKAGAVGEVSWPVRHRPRWCQGACPPSSRLLSQSRCNEFFPLPHFSQSNFLSSRQGSVWEGLAKAVARKSRREKLDGSCMGLEAEAHPVHNE